MADATMLSVEPDEEERELERQILVLERKAKLRERLKELRQAEEAADSHVGNMRADPEEHHVLGAQPQPRGQLEELDESRDRTDLVEPRVSRPAQPTAGNASSADTATSIVAPELPLPLIPRAKQGSPDFLAPTMFGLLGCADPTNMVGTGGDARGGNSRRPMTHALGVAIEAQLDPTFYSVDNQWMMHNSDDFRCTCSYSLTTLRRDEGPLLFQPRRALHAYRVFNLAMSISAVFVGQDPKSVALGQCESDSREAPVRDLEGPVLLAPKPHMSAQDQHSLWWTRTNDEDGRIRGSSSSGSGELPAWRKHTPREHRFERVRFKKREKATADPTSASTAVPEAPVPSAPAVANETRQKHVKMNHIHVRVELMANVGNGEWIKVAHRKSVPLIIRSGGSKNPDKWHIN